MLALILLVLGCSEPPMDEAMPCDGACIAHKADLAPLDAEA